MTTNKIRKALPAPIAASTVLSKNPFAGMAFRPHVMAARPTATEAAPLQSSCLAWGSLLSQLKRNASPAATLWEARR